MKLDSRSKRSGSDGDSEDWRRACTPPRLFLPQLGASRRSQRARKPVRNFQRFPFAGPELQRTLKKLQTIQLSWTISDGVKIHELPEENWDQYVQLASTSPHDAVLKCARDFEKFLNIMRFNFALAIPAKYGDQYSIGEMKDTFFDWIEKKKIQHSDPDYEAKWQKLRQWLKTHFVLRNMAGAHYNEWATNLSSGEAKDFVVLIKDLTSLFKCPSCQRNWVQYSTETKAVHCKYCSDNRKPNAPLWQTKG